MTNDHKTVIFRNNIQSNQQRKNQIMDAPNEAAVRELSKNANRESFNSKVNALLEAKNMTISQVASLCPIAQSTLYAVINGTRPLQRRHVLMIAIALKLTVQETDDLLNHTQFCTLDSYDPTDIYIIHGLEQQKSIEDIESLLEKDHRCLHLFEEKE